MRCVECGGRVVLTPEGYYVCEECGLVQPDIISYSISEEARTREKSGSIGTYVFVFDTKNLSSNNIKSIIRKNTHLLMTSKVLARRKAERTLRRISYYIGLGGTEIEAIVEEYVKLLDPWKAKSGNWAPTITNGLLAAILYVELHRRGRLVAVKDIVDAFAKAGKRISESQVLYGLHFLRKLGLGHEVREDIAVKYVVSLLVKTGLPVYKAAEMKERIAEMIEKYGKISGRRRKSLYAAIAYLLVSETRRISYREFCRRTGTPLSTLRENVAAIKAAISGEASVY